MADTNIQSSKVLPFYNNRTANTKGGGAGHGGGGPGDLTQRVDKLETEFAELNINLEKINESLRILRRNSELTRRRIGEMPDFKDLNNKIPQFLTLKDFASAMAFILIALCGLYYVVTPIWIKALQADLSDQLKKAVESVLEKK